MLLEPLPPFNRVFSMIQQQECQHQMLNHSPSLELMAMMANTNSYHPKHVSKSTNSGGQKSARPYCTHCKIQGHSLENYFKVGNASPPLCTHCNMIEHSVEKCYKLHGYPLGHKLHGKNKSFVATVTPSWSCLSDEHDAEPAETMALTKNQYNQLIALQQSKDTSSAMATISIAQPSSSPSPNHLSTSNWYDCLFLLSNTQIHFFAHHSLDN